MDVFAAGAWRTPKRAELFVGGSWRNVTRAEATLGSDWHQIVKFIKPMALSVPSEVRGVARPPRPATTTVTSNPAVATPTGGAGPYSYLWTITSGAGALSTPNMASTTIRASVPSDDIRTGTAHVVCTDALGSTASGDVTYTLSNVTSGLA